MNRSDRSPLGQVTWWLLICIVSLGGVLLVATGGVAAETEVPDCSEVAFEQTDDGYYEVGTLHELQCIGDDDEGPGFDADYVLTDDIDASPTEGWNDSAGFDPIGDFSEPFTGTFDGNDHTITALHIDHEAGAQDGIGLFANVRDGTITDLTLEDVNVTGSSYVGSVVGNLRGDGTVESVSATGTVTSDGMAAGGLVGQTRATVENSSATVDVTGTFQVGGLVGGVNRGTVSESSANGSVTADRGVGGLVGYNLAGTIEHSHSTIDVTIDGDAWRQDASVGGLLGENIGGTVDGSFATGDVHFGDSNAGVGGLVGVNSNALAADAALIENSYATGDVTGTAGVGGLVGLNEQEETDAEIESSYAIGDVTGEDDVGGLVGENDNGSVTESYWDDDAATVVEDGQEVDGQSDGGEPLTTAEMTGANATATMDGFEFTDRWHATEDYPALAWEETYPVYEVTITATNAPVDQGDTLEVTATVTNWGATGDSTVTLTDTGFADQVRDEVEVDLPSGESNDTVDLEWVTDAYGDGDVTVASETDDDVQTVTIEATEPDLAVDEFAEQLPDGEAGDEYGTVEIPVEELAGVETEGLEVSLEIAGDVEGVVFDETVDDRELDSGSDEFAFDVGQIAAADEYTATVTADAANAEAETRTETFVVLEPEPALSDYVNDDGVVDTDGLRAAIDDWRAGEIDTDLLLAVIDAWKRGD